MHRANVGAFAAGDLDTISDDRVPNRPAGTLPKRCTTLPVMGHGRSPRNGRIGSATTARRAGRRDRALHVALRFLQLRHELRGEIAPPIQVVNHPVAGVDGGIDRRFRARGVFLQRRDRGALLR